MTGFWSMSPRDLTCSLGNSASASSSSTLGGGGRRTFDGCLDRFSERPKGFVSYDDVVVEVEVEVELYPDNSMRSEGRELYRDCLSTGDCASLLPASPVSNKTPMQRPREMSIARAHTYG